MISIKAGSSWMDSSISRPSEYSRTPNTMLAKRCCRGRPPIPSCRLTPDHVHGRCVPAHVDKLGECQNPSVATLAGLSHRCGSVFLVALPESLHVRGTCTLAHAVGDTIRQSASSGEISMEIPTLVAWWRIGKHLIDHPTEAHCFQGRRMIAASLRPEHRTSTLRRQGSRQTDMQSGVFTGHMSAREVAHGE